MIDRRTMLGSLVGGGAAALWSIKAASAASAAVTESARSRIRTIAPARMELPKTRRDKPPFTSPGFIPANAAEFDYIAEEWFASGRDDAGRPYQTQIVACRPRVASRFSGTLIVETLHSAGIVPVCSYTTTYLMRSGHAWAYVASQKMALDSRVKTADADYYAALHIETDPPLPGAPVDLTQNLGSGAPGEQAIWEARERHNQASNIILAQAGAAFRAATGPFAGFKPRCMLLVGHSQTGVAVTNYVNQGHDIYGLAGGRRVYDGFLPCGAAMSPYGPRAAPIIQVISEGDVSDADIPMRPPFVGRPYRRPDSDAPNDRYRLYELAGLSHAGQRLASSSPAMRRGMGIPDDTLPNSLPHAQLFWMSLNHLVQWVDRGVTPPRAPRLALASGGRYFAKDEHGNTLGGVRCTQMDVPRATYLPNRVHPDGTPAGGNGTEVPFSPEKMVALYGNRAMYIERFNRRLDELIKEGWFMPEDRDDSRAEAEAQHFG